MPYGGGQGMVMKPEPLVAAIEHVVGGGAAAPHPARRARHALRSATRRRAGGARRACSSSAGATRASTSACARTSTRSCRSATTSSPAASSRRWSCSTRSRGCCPASSATRRRPRDDSFATGLLEYPQYTRPWTFRGADVPDVLGSGDHAAIARWRREQTLRTTLARRPDLLAHGAARRRRSRVPARARLEPRAEAPDDG